MPEKIEKQITGGAIDESLKDETVQILRKISKDAELNERIGRLFGSFRLDRAYRNTSPGKSHQLIHLDQIVRDIDRLVKDIKLIPEDFKALATDVQLRLDGRVYESAEADLFERLYRYRAMALHVTGEIKKWPSWMAQTNELEYRLLSDVFALLKPLLRKKGETVKKAREILSAEFGEIGLAEAPESLLKRIPKEIKNHPTTIPK